MATTATAPRQVDTRQNRVLANYIPPGSPIRDFDTSRSQYTRDQITAAAKKFAEYIWNPTAYVQDIILKGRTDIIEPHQADIMDLVAEHNRIAIKAANGIGKDTVSAWLIEWFTVTRPLSKVPCTSGVFRQIRSMLWSEVNKWSKNSLASPWLHILDTRLEVKGYQEEWFAEGFTADEEKKAEGYHAHHMLYIITEAKAVRDQIWNAVFKACSGENNKIFCQSVPGGQIGEFFNIFSKYRATWKTFSFAAARSFDSIQDGERQRVYRPTTRLVSQASINEKLDRGGEDSPLFQAGVLANFLTQTEDSLIPLAHVELAMSVLHNDKLHPLTIDAPVELGVDVARFGDDSSVIAARRGPSIFKMKEMFKQDTMALTGEVVSWIRHLRPRAVKVDVIGVGSGVVDRLVELTEEARAVDYQIQKERKTKIDRGEKLSDYIPDPLATVQIIGVNVGEAPDDNTEREKFKNKRSQYWAMIRDKFKVEEIGLLEDPELAVQLTTPKYRFSSDGKLEVESKESMKARGFDSPDKADAIILAFVPWEKGGLNVFF